MKQKNGFTLVELVVTMVVACILMAALVPFLPLAQNGTYIAQRESKVTQAGDAIYEYISNQLKNADRVYLGDGSGHMPADPAGWNKITVNASGLLTVNGQALYPESYQENCILTLNATGLDRDQLRLGVALTDQRAASAGEVIYDKTAAFKLANLETMGFGQTEGIVGVALRAAADQAPQTDGALTGVGSLVIYYQGGGNSVPDFNPGDGTLIPDPSPAPDTLSVVMPSRIDLQVNDNYTLTPKIVWPQNATAQTISWDIPSGINTYLRAVASADKSFVSLMALQVTDEVMPLTVKVSCVVNGETKTAFATCNVRIWHPQTGTAALAIVPDQRVNNTAEILQYDIANKTFFVPLSKSILTLYVYPTDRQVLASGSWKEANGYGGAHTVTNLDGTTGAGIKIDVKIYSVGKATLTFTADGTMESNATPPSGLKGSTASFDIVVYDPTQIAAKLTFADGSTDYTAYYAGIPNELLATAKYTLTYDFSSLSSLSPAVANKVISDLDNAFPKLVAVLTNNSSFSINYPLQWMDYSTHLQNPNQDAKSPFTHDGFGKYSAQINLRANGIMTNSWPTSEGLWGIAFSSADGGDRAMLPLDASGTIKTNQITLRYQKLPASLVQNNNSTLTDLMENAVVPVYQSPPATVQLAPQISQNLTAEQKKSIRWEITPDISKGGNLYGPGAEESNLLGQLQFKVSSDGTSISLSTKSNNNKKLYLRAHYPTNQSTYWIILDERI